MRLLVGKLPAVIVFAFAASWLAPATPQEPDRKQAPAAPPTPGDDIPYRVARLVRQLGSDSYSDRLDAGRELARIGPESRSALEAAMLSDDPEVRLQAGELLRRFKADDLWSAGHVSLKSRGEPASKVLAELASQTGNHLFLGLSYGAFSDTPVDLDYPADSFWPTVDDICRRTGNHVRAEFEGRIRGALVVAGNPGEFPTAYAGPLRAQITEEQRNFSEKIHFGDQKSERSHTFDLELNICWEDRFRLLAYRAQPEVVEALTDSGVRLSSLQPSGGHWNVLGNGERQVSASLKLTPPPTTAKQLDRLALKWSLLAIGDMTTLALSGPAAGQTRRQDDLELTIERFDRQEGNRIEATVLISRDQPLPDPPEIVFQEYTVELFDAEGRASRVQSQANVLAHGGAQLRLVFGGDFEQFPPKTLRLTYPRLRDQRDLELTFRKVPLPVSRPE